MHTCCCNRTASRAFRLEDSFVLAGASSEKGKTWTCPRRLETCTPFVRRVDSCNCQSDETYIKRQLLQVSLRHKQWL